MIFRSACPTINFQRKAMQPAHLLDETQCFKELLSDFDFTRYHLHQIQQQVYRHSFDMLGEAALSQLDADNHFNIYLQANEYIKSQNSKLPNYFPRPAFGGEGL